MANSYWVTWKDESNSTAARNSALIWGPQAGPPPRLAGTLESGPFPTKAAATAYKNSIGTGSILPAPGTPLIGDVQPPNPLNGLAAIGDFFSRLTEKATWIRVAEIAIGAAVVIATINHLAGNPIGKTAVKAGMAAAVA